MNKQEFTVIDLENRKAKCILWTPDDASSIKCVLQIAHGMEEHIERYENFAEYLCNSGFAVCGNDHPGHGITLPVDNLGHFGKAGYLGCVNRMHCVTLAIKQKFCNSPVILLGHSMGSFMTRAYITRYGKELNGAIIMGTSGPNPLLNIGSLVIKILSLFKGDKAKSKFVDNFMFGAYNEHFDGDSRFEWLSKDKTIVKAYEDDPYCGFGFTMNGYNALMDVMKEISKKDWAKKVPKDLPILVISGEDDPVGDYGAGIKIVHERLSLAGVKNLSLKLFKNDRHEILNETDKEDVYNAVISFMENII